MAKGADILIHKVVSELALSMRTQFWQDYHRSNHTTSFELADSATRAQPKRLVFYRVLVFGLDDEVVLDEARERYDGEVIRANDLDVFD